MLRLTELRSAHYDQTRPARASRGPPPVSTHSSRRHAALLPRDISYGIAPRRIRDDSWRRAGWYPWSRGGARSTWAAARTRADGADRPDDWGIRDDSRSQRLSDVAVLCVADRNSAGGRSRRRGTRHGARNTCRGALGEAGGHARH